LDSITGTTAFNLLESQTADINFGNLTSATVNCNSFKLNKLDSITGTIDFNLLESQTANINIGNITSATVQCNHLKANKLSSQTLTTAFDLLKNHTANINIGETSTGTSGQVIQIGPPTLTKICLGEIEIQGSAINNSVNPSDRNVSIGLSQSDIGAELNLGTNAGRKGPINIGSGNTTATPEINIGAGGTGTSIRAGATINIGKLTTNPITIGNASANVTINSSSGSIKTNSLTVSGTSSLNGDLSMGANKNIFTTSGQQLRLGYASTQSSALPAASLGPFFKSFGPANFTTGTYDILYEGANGLFTATGLDGCGGLLTITIKNTINKFATYVYSMCKRNGVFAFDSLLLISTNVGGWATSPTISRVGNTNNITITFINTADWTGATVSWMFLGSS
jgi:hypothetical protein